VCPECNTPVTEQQAKLRRDRGFNHIRCNVCDTRIWLLDREERLVEIMPSALPEMNGAADLGRDRDTAATILKGKGATNDFDVFISCNRADEEWVYTWFLPRLEERGIHAYTGHHFSGSLSILENIRQAMDLCSKTLLVLTPRWVENEWDYFESLLLQADDPSNLHRRILLLMLEKYKPPSLSLEKHLTRLHRILDARFNKGELRAFCSELDVDYENLPGEGKESKARELVDYLKRRDRILDLVETGKRLRPDITWIETASERLLSAFNPIDFTQSGSRERESDRIINVISAWISSEKL
jgi:hypothetical protein